MARSKSKDQEVWKNALKTLSADQKPATKVNNEETAPVKGEVIQEILEKEQQPEQHPVPQPSRKHQRVQSNRLGNYHAPTEYDKESLEATKALIKEIYDQYEGESLEELAGQLEEAGIHIHKITKDNTPAIRAFYHPPIIVTLPDRELPDKDILFENFYIDLILPKEEPVEEETVEEEPKKESWWKRLFGKN